MDLYQIGLYRKGQQDVNSGWQLVSPSVGISNVAAGIFEQIASEIISVKNKIISSSCRGIFQREGFVYFININFNAKGEDERGVSYAHCFCFTMEDFLELTKTPEKLAGIYENVFPTEYDDSIKAYPIEHDLPCKKMDWKIILDKYGISVNLYREMILAAICSAIGKSSPLCIKKKLEAEEYEQFYNDMLYIILKGLPEYLRVKVSSFSFREYNRAILYVSDVIGGDNYIDLDMGNANVQYAPLSQYQFTKIYNNLIASEDIRVLNGLWTEMSEQIESTIDNPLNDINLDMIEAAFQSTLKKSEAGSETIEARRSVDLLTAFLGLNILETSKTFLYIRDLLEVINNNGLYIKNNEILNKLNNYYKNKLASSLCIQIDNLYVRTILQGTSVDNGFDLLDSLYRSNRLQYENVYSAITTQNVNYTYNYYIERILPQKLNSFDDINNHLNDIKNENGDGIDERLIEKDYNIVVGSIGDLVSETMKNVNSYDELCKAYNDAIYSLSKIPDEMTNIKENASDLLKKIKCAFWDNFNLNWFLLEESNNYETYGLTDVLQKYTNYSKTNNAQEVFELCVFKDGILNSKSFSLIKRIVYTDEFDLSNMKKAELENILLELWFKKGYIDLYQEQDGFDALLTLCYDPQKKSYKVIQFANILNEITEGLFFKNVNIERFVKRSQILHKNQYKEQFISDVKEFNLTYRNNKKITQDNIAKGLNKCVDVLKGKELMNSKKRDMVCRFFTSLYQLFYGVAALGSFIIFTKITKSYIEWNIGENFVFGLSIAVITFGYFGIGMINLLHNDGLDGLFHNKALDVPVRLILYVVLLLLSVAILLANVLLHKFTMCILAVVVYLIIGSIIMIISDNYAE